MFWADGQRRFFVGWLSQGGQATEAGLISQSIENGLEDLPDSAPAIIHAGVDDRPADADKFRPLAVGDEDIGCASDSTIEPDAKARVGFLHFLMNFPKNIDRAGGVEHKTAAMIADIDAIGS